MPAIRSAKNARYRVSNLVLSFGSHSILMAAFKGRCMCSGPIADLDKVSLAAIGFTDGEVVGPSVPMHLANAGSLGDGAWYPEGVGARPPQTPPKSVRF